MMSREGQLVGIVADCEAFTGFPQGLNGTGLVHCKAHGLLRAGQANEAAIWPTTRQQGAPDNAMRHSMH